MSPIGDKVLRLTLRQGSVYFMRHRALTSPLRHFCVVMNAAPLSDEVIVLGVVTSSVDLRRERIRLTGEAPETLVEIGPADYTELDHASAIDCNDAKRMSASDFEAEFRARSMSGMADLPAPVVERVVAGILASRAVPAAVKALVKPLPSQPIF